MAGATARDHVHEQDRAPAAGSRGRRGNYPERELEDWAQRFETWSRDVGVLAYFNNDWEVFAVRNALWLKRRLAG